MREDWDNFSAIGMACGPLMRIIARAETPGGVAQAVMVSFSNAIADNTFANLAVLGRVLLIGSESITGAGLGRLGEV